MKQARRGDWKVWEGTHSNWEGIFGDVIWGRISIDEVMRVQVSRAEAKSPGCFSVMDIHPLIKSLLIGHLLCFGFWTRSWENCCSERSFWIQTLHTLEDVYTTYSIILLVSLEQLLGLTVPVVSFATYWLKEHFQIKRVTCLPRESLRCLKNTDISKDWFSHCVCCVPCVMSWPSWSGVPSQKTRSLSVGMALIRVLNFFLELLQNLELLKLSALGLNNFL